VRSSIGRKLPGCGNKYARDAGADIGSTEGRTYNHESTDRQHAGCRVFEVLHDR
jgi:hypothetical protein